MTAYGPTYRSFPLGASKVVFTDLDKLSAASSALRKRQGSGLKATSKLNNSVTGAGRFFKTGSLVPALAQPLPRLLVRKDTPERRPSPLRCSQVTVGLQGVRRGGLAGVVRLKPGLTSYWRALRHGFTKVFHTALFKRQVSLTRYIAKFWKVSGFTFLRSYLLSA